VETPVTEQTIISTALVGLIALLIGGVFGHILRRKEPTPDNSSETARYEEREKALAAQAKRFEDQNRDLSAAIETHLSTEISLRSELATEKANVSSRDKALIREKEVAEKEASHLTADLTDARSRYATLSHQANEQGNQLAALTQLETELRGQLDRAEAHIAERDRKLAAKEAALSDANAKLANHGSELAAAKEREISLQRDVASRDDLLKNLQAQFVKEFENIAGKVLEATSEKLSTQSNDALTGILEPLRTRIGEFQKRIEDTHTEAHRKSQSFPRPAGGGPS
jgi:chromosome segregation ATPase